MAGQFWWQYEQACHFAAFFRLVGCAAFSESSTETLHCNPNVFDYLSAVIVMKWNGIYLLGCSCCKSQHTSTAHCCRSHLCNVWAYSTCTVASIHVTLSDFAKCLRGESKFSWVAACWEACPDGRCSLILGAGDGFQQIASSVQLFSWKMRPRRCPGINCMKRQTMCSMWVGVNALLGDALTRCSVHDGHYI